MKGLSWFDFVLCFYFKIELLANKVFRGKCLVCFLMSYSYYDISKVL